MKIVRTRIAPSPTGDDLHIGNAYTALINYVFAKKNNGKFIVRVEDTDRSRLVPGSEQKILASLSWLGLDPDESPEKGGPFAPYRQSERLDQYQKYAQELIAKDRAYYCFCTPERLEKMRLEQQAKHEPPMYDGTCRNLKSQIASHKVKQGEKHTVRLKVPKDGMTKFTDVIRGEISFENKLIDDQVLLKSDGFPTYHLGVVVDDHLMEISHIIRGEEWISSTPKHVLLYQFFGWQPPIFAHMPLLRNPDKSKLSKRKNPVWVSWYKDQGFLPEALLNYLATLAWAHPEGKDIFSLEEMMQSFELNQIQTTAPIFNIEKLRWVNRHYLQKLSPDNFASSVSTASIAVPHFRKIAQDESFKRIVAGTATLVQPRISTPIEYYSIAGFFHERPKEYERQLNKKWLEKILEGISYGEWKKEILEQKIRALGQLEEINPADLFMELRIAITGKSVGPPLLESLEYLGKQEAIERIKVAIK